MFHIIKQLAQWHGGIPAYRSEKKKENQEV